MLLAQEKLLGVKLGIVHGHGQREVILGIAMKALLHVGIDGVGIAVLGGAGAIVEAGGMHDNGVVVLPMTHGVAVVSGIEAVFAGLDIGGQSASVGPDFAPDVHVLNQDEGAAGKRGDGYAANFVGHILRKAEGIAI